MYFQHVCILLYVIVIWCNGISEICCQLESGGRCILSIYAFCYMWHLFGVMVSHRCIVNWSGGYMYPQYMCILLYVKLIWCNGIPWIYCTVGVLGESILSICAFCYMWHLFGVMVFHRCIVNWSGGYMYSQYMCILLYVTLIWCNGIP